MQKINLSVVIATYNRPKLALNLAKEILKQQKVEIIIVEQISDLIKSKNPQIKVINSKIANLPHARNLGLNKSRGEVILFLDDDVEITDKLIKAHLDSYQNKSVVGVAGRVINDGEIIPTNTNVITGQTNSILTKFWLNFWGTKTQNVQFPYGCNMSFRKSALLEVNGFDDIFSPPLSAFEEIDLSLRIGKYGKIVFAPQALVYHHQAKSGGTRTIKHKEEYYFGYGRLIHKHLRGWKLVSSLTRLIARILKEDYTSLISFLHGYKNI